MDARGWKERGPRWTTLLVAACIRGWKEGGGWVDYNDIVISRLTEGKGRRGVD